MTFYNVISAILFLGAFQQLLLAVEILSCPRIVMAAMLALLVFNDALFTSHVVEGEKRVNYTLNLKIIDLANFLLLAMAMVIMSPKDNVFNVKVPELGTWLPESSFWAFLSAYWLLVMGWCKQAGWYPRGYPRWLIRASFTVAVLFLLEAMIIAIFGEGVLATTFGIIVILYLAWYVWYFRPRFLSGSPKAAQRGDAADRVLHRGRSPRRWASR